MNNVLLSRVADDLVSAFNDGYKHGYDDAKAEQKRGAWEERIVEDPEYDPYGFFKQRFYCSACGRWQTHGKTKFCHNCGAKMEREVET